MKFALYFIPQEGEFYYKGSTLLGYDIRNKKNIPQPEWVISDWMKNAVEYGFHLTITDAVECKPEDLSKITKNTQMLLDCFPKTGQFKLDLYEEPVSFWPSDKRQAALKFVPNISTTILHTALVCFVQCLGTGSLYYDQLIEDPNRYEPSDIYKTKRTKLFWSPYIFDDFKPHFSVINPYTEQDHAIIQSRLNEWFKVVFHEIQKIQMTSLCLVVQRNQNDYFEIYKEYRLL